MCFFISKNAETVTANTPGGFTKISAPLWARGQDNFLVIHRLRDRAQLATNVK